MGVFFLKHGIIVIIIIIYRFLKSHKSLGYRGAGVGRVGRCPYSAGCHRTICTERKCDSKSSGVKPADSERTVLPVDCREKVASPLPTAVSDDTTSFCRTVS